MNRRLYRCYHDRKIAGVASGLAEYFDVDPTIVRVLWVFSVFFGGVGLLLYIALAIIVPIEPQESAVSGTPLADTSGEAAGDAAVASPTGWQSPPVQHRHASRGAEWPDRDLRGRRPDPVRRTGPHRRVPSVLGGRRALPVARVHRRDRGHPRGDRSAKGAERIVNGGAALIVGLLLILTGLAAARIPGGATFASSGTGVSARSPIRAFLLSPIHPATWYANAAIGLGFVIGIFAFLALFAIGSTGLATILAGIGIVFLAMTIEGARLVARLERWRATLGSPTRLIAHPYRPLRGGIVAILRAEFADENRWRDVLYVGVNFPLAVIEFTVIALAWWCSLWLLTMPLWYDAIAGATLPSVVRATRGTRRCDHPDPDAGRTCAASRRGIALAAGDGAPPCGRQRAALHLGEP